MKFIPLSLLTFAVSVPLVVAQQTTPSPQPSTGSSPQIASPQQTNPQPGAPQPGSSGVAAVPGTTKSPEVSNPGLRPIPGQLVTKLDTKDTKTGDNVIIKTTEKATTASGIEIPKGSRITGHVTDVAAKGTSGDNSRLTIQLDQAEITGGQNLAIRSVIQSVAPAGSGNSADANGGPPAVPSEGSTNGSTASPTSGSATPGATSTDNRAAQGAAPSTAPGLPPPGSVVAQKGNIVIRTTSIPGVLLVGDVNGHPFSNAAGALLGARQDVHLDDGTMMVVAVMEVPSPNAH